MVLIIRDFFGVKNAERCVDKFVDANVKYTFLWLLFLNMKWADNEIGFKSEMNKQLIYRHANSIYFELMVRSVSEQEIWRKSFIDWPSELHTPTVHTHTRALPFEAMARHKVCAYKYIIYIYIHIHTHTYLHTWEINPYRGLVINQFS